MGFYITSSPYQRLIVYWCIFKSLTLTKHHRLK